MLNVRNSCLCNWLEGENTRISSTNRVLWVCVILNTEREGAHNPLPKMQLLPVFVERQILPLNVNTKLY